MEENDKPNQGLAWLVGVLWLFGVVILVLMGLSTAAVVLFIMLFVFAAFVTFWFHAPPEAFGTRHKARTRANRNAGRTYRVQTKVVRKSLHDRQ